MLLTMAACQVSQHDRSSGAKEVGLADDTRLSDAIVLVIRHAEKTENGPGLSPVGQKRAKAYVQYFKDFSVDSRPLDLDCLVAGADSEKSHRPRLTLEPLAEALRLRIELEFATQQYQELADVLRSQPHGKHILICWRHEKIPELLQSLGGDPNEVLPDGKWPDQEYAWVVQLRYDLKGHLSEAKRIDEGLIVGDAK